MRPSGLHPDRWQRIDEVFDAVLDRPEPERAALLDELCKDDAALRAEVEALLTARVAAERHFSDPVLALDMDALDIDTPPPERIGPFRILEEIGRGGMGVVYAAEDTRLGRRVALKVLPPYMGRHEEAVRHLETEAKAVSALDHPNVATIHDIGLTEQGQPYVVFAHYVGETLAERIARGALSAEEAIAIAVGIARGLGAAHARGIIHRDVKPSNVLLTEGGEVKLLDFGVAKVHGVDRPLDEARVGTLAYMSPEQLVGGDVDPRSDLWALGTVVHEMLTGRRPFDAETPSALMQEIAREDAPALALPASQRFAGLEQLVGRLLQRQPHDRPTDAGVVAGELERLRRRLARSDSHLAPHPTVSAVRGRRATLLAAVVLAIAAVGWWVSSTGGDPMIQRLAVLPLENLTGDPEQQYLVDGIHEALIAELGQIGTLDVISRPSVLPYGGTDRTIPDIANELNVDGVVVGSVFRGGDSIAVTASLVAPSPERSLWQARLGVDAGRMFAITGEVARAISDEIQGALSDDAESRLAADRPVDPDVYDAYLRGRFHLDRRSREGFEQARNFLRRATALDPTFAPAYVSLAESHGSAANFGMVRPVEGFARARAFVDQALDLDSLSAEAHFAVSAIAFFHDWDLAASEAAARRALELNPSLARAHRRLAEVLFVTGRGNEAMAAVDRARELDRLSPVSDYLPVLLAYLSRDFDGAADQARVAAGFHTGFWQLEWLRCLALAGSGDFSEATTACERAATDSNRNPLALGALGHVLASHGQRADAIRIVEELEGMSRERYVGGVQPAAVLGALGDNDRAFSWLDRAVEDRDVLLVHLAHLPFLDPLREDPRFGALEERLGIGR